VTTTPETKFTKGPFRVTDHGDFATVYEGREDGFHVATFVGPTELTQPLANARLFVAAHKLYAALFELVVASRECTEKVTGPREESDAAINRLIAAERAAETTLAEVRIS